MEGSCFGEYGNHLFCKQCTLQLRCKKFTSLEREVTLRYKGKYTGRGKESKRDRY